ncbi:MAG: type II toxin-antitoxin system VapB family antitoxin [Desulfuromonadales bacterium]
MATDTISGIPQWPLVLPDELIYFTSANDIIWGLNMARTVVNIDDSLYEQARLFTGLKKKVDVVNYALKHLLEQRDMEKILELRGTIIWEGNLDEMRQGRNGSR